MARADYQKILSSARWIQQNIRLIRWNAREFEQLFGARSARDVLMSGETNYLNACLDQTMAFIQLVKKKGYNPHLVVDENVSRHTQEPTLHFAIEIPLKEKTLTVDFESSTKLVYYDGKYDPTKATHPRKSLQIQRFPTRGLHYRTTLNQFLGVEGTRTLYKRFPYVSPGAAHAVFKRMGERDTAARFQTAITARKTRRRIR